MYGLAAFYDRERDLFSIKDYYHCSCDGTNYEDAGPFRDTDEYLGDGDE